VQRIRSPLGLHVALAAGGLTAWGLGQPEVALALVLVGGLVAHITSRLRLRHDAAGYQARYQRLVEEIPLTLYISSLAREGGSLYVSPAIESLLGFTVAAWAEDVELFEKILHPDDHDRVVAAVARSKRDGTPYSEQYRLVGKDGGVVWVQDSAVTVRDERGRPLYWQGFLLDISTRKRAEARYQTLVEQLPLITYIDSPTGATTNAAYVSPQVEAILGYPRADWTTVPGFFLERVHPDDRAMVTAGQDRARRTGTPMELEYRFVAADGRIVWLYDTYGVVNDDAGRPWYTQGVAYDITSRKEAEADRETLLAQTQEQNEQLKQLDRMKDEFIALVSHELRTPLTSICGYLELLSDDAEDAGLGEIHRDSIRVIERNSERLLRLVEDLLLTAQVAAGNLVLAPADFDLAEALERAADSARPLAAARGIELVAAAVPSLPMLHGDAHRIGQVIDNLVSNALKFTPPGGTIELTAARSDGGVVIAVTDSGVGISSDDLRRLFDRFFRTESAQRNAIPGIGLGLAIARAIVEAHEGTITVESTPGVGTTFRIELPLRAALVAA
jgi:PAS domain S-box-containing protein